MELEQEQTTVSDGRKKSHQRMRGGGLYRDAVNPGWGKFRRWLVRKESKEQGERVCK